MKTPVLLAILDGLGLDEPSNINAVSLANSPYLDSLLSGERYPMRQIEASGEDVGLPAGQMGNSEVGHLNIGSGRIVYQDLSKINNAIADGSFFENEVLVAQFSKLAETGGALHLLGLLSDGGVHSEFTHLKALIDMAADRGVKEIYIHPFLDGRDVSPTSGLGFVTELQDFAAETSRRAGNTVQIASIGGRYFAMDRDNRWDRVKRAWDVIVVPEPDTVRFVGNLPASDIVAYSYADGITDEFLEPVCLNRRGVIDGDGIMFFNFRPDRAREMTRAFTQEDFAKFDRVRAPKVDYVCMTGYDESFDLPIAFPKTIPPMVLADKIADMGLRQFHIAETEKYAHVTFFLNGGVEEAKPGEKRVLIPSPKVATYDLQPEMSAIEVTDTLIDAMLAGEAEFYIVNYANCDMVGHTGHKRAAVKAVETVDACLVRLIGTLEELGGVGLVIADHGNCEKMVTEDGSPHTAHTTAPVPIIAIDASGSGREISFVEGEGRLADVAPTLFDLAEIDDVPAEWTGRSLLA